MQEYLTQQKLRLTVQIFASDLDSRAIETARAGLYPVGIAGDIAPARLQRFFTKEDSSYRVKKEIRDLVVFATHNILTDAPFTKLDLLSCRNLLIYLEAKAQHKLLPLFHYALKPNGILFLGSSETIGEFESLFTVIDRKWKLFRRTAEPGSFLAWNGFLADLMRGDNRDPAWRRGSTITNAPHLDSRSDPAALGIALRAGGGRRQRPGRGRLYPRAHRRLSRTGARPADSPSDRDGAGRIASTIWPWRSIRRPARRTKSCVTTSG